MCHFYLLSLVPGHTVCCCPMLFLHLLSTGKSRLRNTNTKGFALFYSRTLSELTARKSAAKPEKPGKLLTVKSPSTKQLPDTSSIGEEELLLVSN